MIEEIKDFLYFFKIPIMLIIGSTIFLISIVSLIKPKENLTVSITPEQELESIRIVEKNEKWFEGYKQGQIEAINGRINFKLKKNHLGEIVWEHK